ncbi:hypothetical protein JB92DRAFT_3117778 [Gautieria morchelliformis]|nr:hypothetical protein JB92DRAFT_3117778 [Gautieria morchelliformis]
MIDQTQPNTEPVPEAQGTRNDARAASHPRPPPLPCANRAGRSCTWVHPLPLSPPRALGPSPPSLPLSPPLPPHARPTTHATHKPRPRQPAPLRIHNAHAPPNPRARPRRRPLPHSRRPTPPLLPSARSPSPCTTAPRALPSHILRIAGAGSAGDETGVGKTAGLGAAFSPLPLRADI